MNFSDTFSNITQISNLLKFRPVGDELLHADKSRFSQILLTRLKSGLLPSFEGFFF